MNMITMNDDYNGILLDSQGNTSNITINGDLMFNSRTGEFVNVIRNGYSNIMTDFNGEVYNVQYRKQVNMLICNSHLLTYAVIGFVAGIVARKIVERYKNEKH